MRVGRKARRVAQLVAEIQQVVFGQAAFEKGARVYAGRGMALEIDEIARLIAVAAAEKMVETDFGDRGKRGVGRNVAADVRVVFVGPHHHGRRVPANHALDSALHLPVARIGRFFVRRNRIDVRSVDFRGHAHAESGGAIQQFLK